MAFVRRPLALVALGCTLAACSGAAPTGGADDAPPIGRTASDLTGNDKTAFDYFLGKGLTNFQAAAIVGNLDQESGMDPTIAEPGGPGRGIAQWSVGGRWDTSANDNAKSYASSNGQSVYALTTQLDFIWYELTTFSSFGLADLQQSTTLTDAVVVFQNKFEACGACNESQRISFAEAALQAYGNDVPTGSPPPPPMNDAGTGYGPCTVPGIDSPGECMTTTDCAAMPGYVSTPGYCPGANDIQCCTGPSGNGGGNGNGSSGGNGNGPSDPGAGDAGAGDPGSALNPGHATDGGKGSGYGSWSGASDFGGGNSGGCSASGARGAGGDASSAFGAFGVLLFGLGRRARRRARAR